ncbi:MAG TPA: CehA/McbA family metallohydrolase [Bryobacteraceae bacterium]|jgi:hypothetical protein
MPKPTNPNHFPKIGFVSQNLTLALRATLLALTIWGAYHLTAQSEANLSVEIRDAATGEITPAMVCITSLADHKWRTPPDGAYAPRYSRVRDFYDPAPWTPGQIGPVRLTTAKPRDNQARVPAYTGSDSYPYWHEPAAYFVPQPFSIRLPAGKYRLAVAHGPEFTPYTEEFEVPAAATLTRKIALKRWVDMPHLGWYSGDDHVHYPRLNARQSEFLLTWARAEDLHLANILRMGDAKDVYFEQSAYGKDSHYQQGNYILATGQEDPRTDIAEQGHVIALNTTAPIRDVTRYHQFDFMFDQAHAQGGLAGYAHIAWASDFYTRNNAPTKFPTWDPNIDVPRGKVDFFEILQFRHLGLEDLYDFLNLGYKVTATAGSDFPWGSSMGEVRTYAYTGRSFSAEAWFDAVKHGHTFVTNGPMLTLTADKLIPGDELKFMGSRRLRIHARAWAPPEIGTPKLLEVVVNGKVVRSGTTDLDFALVISKGEWIAARVTCENDAMAHTSPIYFYANGQTFRDQDNFAAIAKNRLDRLDYIESRLTSDSLRAEYAPEQDALRKRIAEARAEYQKLVHEGSK